MNAQLRDKPDSDPTRDLLDELIAERAIRRLLDSYQIAWDSMTVDNIRSAEFFAPHGRLIERGVLGEKGMAEGVDEIVEWHTRRHQMLDERPKGLHTRMNYVIDVDPGCRRATVTGTFIYVLRRGEEFVIGASGRYDDIVERDEDGRWWMVEHRVTVHPPATSQA